MALYGVFSQAFCLQLCVLNLLVFLDFYFFFQLVSCQTEEPVLLNVYKTVQQFKNSTQRMQPELPQCWEILCSHRFSFMHLIKRKKTTNTNPKMKVTSDVHSFQHDKCK